MTETKCPKCKGSNFTIASTCKSDDIYEVKDGVITEIGEGLFSEEISHTCECLICGHVWHPRNFKYEIDNKINN